LNSKKTYLFLTIIIFSFGCITDSSPIKTKKDKVADVSIVVLGNVQDAGSPHIACKKECCRELFLKPNPLRKVVSLGLIDPENDDSYLFEATPNIAEQLKILKSYTWNKEKELPAAVFLTHAHIGHYTGLMYFGKEAMNAQEQSVFAMPKMKEFLEKNGPWSQLVKNKNIRLQTLSSGTIVQLSPKIQVSAFSVPHRDEYSETVGYRIKGPYKSALFIPDIDKWSKWEMDILTEIAEVDYAFLDATFYDAAEINNRDISEIPHPFIVESMELFKTLPAKEKSKIKFIHMNHTNPALDESSDATKTILENGFGIARMHDVFAL